MKIIFITREGYNLPGARIRCYNFSRQLSGYGIDTQVLSFSDTFGAKDGEEESKMGVKEKLKFNYLAFKALSKQKDAIFYLQRFNYHALAPYLVHILKGNRIILDLDDWEMRENPKYYFGVYPASKAHYFTRQIAKRSVFCIAASKFLKEFLMQFNPNVYHISSGVDTDLFKPSLENSSEEEIIFSWIGTLHKKEYIENIQFALDCFSRVRKKNGNIFFDIIGDGIYRQNLIELLNKLGDERVRYKGWLPPDQMPKYLDEISVGLFPIAKDNKFNKAKSPTKLFEYMAMAKPTISGKIGEAKYIVNDGDSGFLADTKEEFIKYMQMLSEDPILRKRMGLRAREAVKVNYSLSVLGKQLFAALSTI